MKTVKILHCADVHIGAAESFLGSAAAGRRAETLLTFERIMDLGVKEKVDIVAIAGDLFDSNRVERELYEPVFEKIAAVAPLRVVLCAGNHDPLTNDSPFKKYPLPENLFVLGTEDTVLSFEDIGLQVYGRSFDAVYTESKPFPPAVSPGDEVVRLGVLHGELTNDSACPYNGISSRYIANSGLDYLALGHIHKRSEIAVSGSTRYAYCGCPEGQGFDETDDKGVLIGEIGHHFCDLRFVSTSFRRHIRAAFEISGSSTAAELAHIILDRLEKENGPDFRNNLYQIKLTGKIPPDSSLPLSELSARLAEELYYVKVKDGTEPEINLDLLAAEPTLMGIFCKKMKAKIEAAQEEEKPLFNQALALGLKAFYTEVKLDDNQAD